MESRKHGDVIERWIPRWDTRGDPMHVRYIWTPSHALPSPWDAYGKDAWLVEAHDADTGRWEYYSVTPRNNLARSPDTIGYPTEAEALVVAVQGNMDNLQRLVLEASVVLEKIDSLNARLKEVTGRS